MSAQIVFVGGGPVGLWTACQTKILNPGAEVVVLEKNRTYQRKHVLSLAHSSFSSAPSDPRIQEVIKRFKQERPSGLFWKNSTISTSKIEEELAKLATELHVDVRKGVMADENTDFKKHFPNVQIVVGADGSHSRIRKIIDSHDFKSNLQLNHIIEVKYFAKGRTEYLKSFAGKSEASFAIGHLAQEHIGGMNDKGDTPITLRLFVSEEEYLSIQDADFKNPYTIEKLPAGLRNTIERFLQKRKELTGEVRVSGSEKITTTPLNAYASQSFVKKENGITYCLVGDAAFGVPYFASANNGLVAGTELARKITSYMKNPQDDKIMNAYARYLRFFSTIEIGKAIVKNMFLKTAETTVSTLSPENPHISKPLSYLGSLIQFILGIFQKFVDGFWFVNSKMPWARSTPVILR